MRVSEVKRGGLLPCSQLQEAMTVGVPPGWVGFNGGWLPLVSLRSATCYPREPPFSWQREGRPQTMELEIGRAHV